MTLSSNLGLPESTPNSILFFFFKWLGAENVWFYTALYVLMHTHYFYFRTFSLKQRNVGPIFQGPMESPKAAETAGHRPVEVSHQGAQIEIWHDQQAILSVAST